MNWPAVERIWLPAWLRDRESILAQVREAIDEAKQRVLRNEVEPDPARRAPERLKPDEAATNGIAYTKIAAAPSSSPQPKRHPSVQPFREYVPRTLGDVSALDQISIAAPSASPRVNAAIAEVIQAEGPIHRDRLARLVGNSFGLNRVSSDRRQTIQRLVAADFRRTADESFFWPAGVDPETWRVVRCPAQGISRPIEEVCLIEIGNAMIVVTQQAGGSGEEELKREALNLLGGRRITEIVELRLKAALKRALAKGLLRQSDGGVISSTGSES
jgi:hypothetical protein